MRYIEPTESQKRIWIIQKMYPNSAMFHIGGVFQTRGNVDMDRLYSAVLDALYKTQLPFIRLEEKEALFIQYCVEEQPLILKKDYRGLNVKSIIEAEFRRKMELLNAPLYQVILYQSDNGVGFYMKVHHIIADGYSMQLFSKLVEKAYAKNISGVPLCCDVIPDIDQFERVFQCEQAYLQAPSFFQDQQYWVDLHQRMKQEERGVPLQDTKALRKIIQIPQKLESTIRYLAKEAKSSIQSIFILAYLMTVSDLRQDEIQKLGIPVLGRSGAKERKLFGMMTNLLLIPFQIKVHSSILDSIVDINRQIRQAYRHLKYPYNYLIRQLSALDIPYRPYYTCVNYYAGRYPQLLDGNLVEIRELFSGESHYDLQIVINDLGTRLHLYFDYNTSCFSDLEIDKLCQNFFSTLSYICANPQKKLERAKDSLPECIEPNCSEPIAQGKPLRDWVIQRVLWYGEICPERVAVKCGEMEITYKGISNMMLSLSSMLQRTIIAQSDVIAVYFDHYLNAVISILAILHTGYAFLPIDAKWPIERIQAILDEAHPCCVLSDRINDGELVTKAIWIQYGAESIVDGEKKIQSELIKESREETSIAYIMYTSGSTGRPKGVMVGRNNLMNYLHFAAVQYQVAEGIVMPLFTSLAFDLTLTSIFLPLYTGGCVKIYQQASKMEIAQIVQDGCTVMKLTPMHAFLLTSAEIKKTELRKLVIGGEDLKATLAAQIHKKFDKKITIYNEYGPTEATIGCMIHEYNPEIDVIGSVPIGTAIPEVEIHLLDDKMKPVVEGECGEIYISGASVSKGYLNNEIETKAHFVSNAATGYSTWYKTNDCAKHIAKNCMVFLGRNDSQVKINGFRVELGEIETICNQLCGINNSVAICTDIEGSLSIILYYTSCSRITRQDVLTHLHRFLPYYMIPKLIIPLSVLPITENQKVDRRILSSPHFIQSYLPNEAQTQGIDILIEQVRNTLGISEEVNAKSNWYALGGDSIKAIELSANMLAQGYVLEIKTILTIPLIGEMAMYLKTAGQTEKDRLQQQSSEKMLFPHPPIYQWFLDQKFNNPNMYAHAILVKLNKRFTLDEIHPILSKLFSLHKSLFIKLEQSEWCYAGIDVYAIEETFCLDRCAAEMHYLWVQKDKEQLDISSGRTFRARLYHFCDGDAICMTAHHIAVDGFSFMILLRDFNELLCQSKFNRTVYAPIQTTPYHKYAMDIVNQSISQKAKDLYANIRWETDLSIWNRSNNSIICTDNIMVDLPQKFCDALARFRQSLGLKPDVLYVAAFLFALRNQYQCKDIVLELEGNDRINNNRGDSYSRTVGWFTNILPISFQDIPCSFVEIYSQVKEKLDCYQQIAWEISLLEKHMSGNHHPPIFKLNVLTLETIFEMFEVNIETQQYLEATNRIEIDLVQQNNRLQIQCRYDTNRFCMSKVTDIIKAYAKSLQDVAGILSECGLEMKVANQFSNSKVTLQDLNKILK